MPWYWILIILSAILGPFEAMHALNKARRNRQNRPAEQPRCGAAYIWDLDGTLLDPESRVTETNKEAIRMADAAGIEIAISTGRALSL